MPRVDSENLSPHVLRGLRCGSRCPPAALLQLCVTFPSVPSVPLSPPPLPCRSRGRFACAAPRWGPPGPALLPPAQHLAEAPPPESSWNSTQHPSSRQGGAAGDCPGAASEASWISQKAGEAATWAGKQVQMGWVAMGRTSVGVMLWQ